MKAILLLAAILAFTGVFAQNNQIFAKFTKSDGSTIKGTSTRRLFENQVIVASYTGGSDNSGVIEIEVPTSTYVGEFRNAMNAANTAAARPAVPVASNKVIAAPVSKAGLSDKVTKTMASPAVQQPGIAKAEITVASSSADANLKPSTKIIMEDLKVEGCTDNAATGTSKIRLRGSRIGWIYYSYPANGGAATTSKSGWDVAAGKAWNNF
ncbi:MAG: hypothetical protein JST68_04225 [Bacteroidetes bacterium]|nr:hypothetical protein [Bacteroidota bacterium]